MTDWHRENGYIINRAIIAAAEMADYLMGKHVNNPDVDGWFFVQMGAELSGLSYMKVGWELHIQ